MGQKRIKIVDSSKIEEKITKKKEVIKSGKAQGRLSDMGKVALAEAEKIEKKRKAEEKKLQKLAESQTKEEVKAKKSKKIRVRSKRYKILKTKVEANKFYSLKEAVDLLSELATSKLDETVEVHISTLVNKLTGTVKLPHGTGKTQKVVIADDKLIDNISNGKIDFDILIATPAMMPKIAKVAKILGPKGLMPNPKTETITDKPEELKKKLEQGELRFKTELKAPLLHLTIGKISFGKEKILENLEALIKVVGLKNIKKAVLTSTQSPGIKLDLTNI